jgi:hypothetical protein
VAEVHGAHGVYGAHGVWSSRKTEILYDKIHCLLLQIFDIIHKDFWRFARWGRSFSIIHFNEFMDFDSTVLPRLSRLSKMHPKSKSANMRYAVGSGFRCKSIQNMQVT